MTKAQILKALKLHGIAGQVSGRGLDWEVELADDAAQRKFVRKVARVGGFRTGYGGWVLRPDYQPMGDWNDRGSRWHC